MLERRWIRMSVDTVADELYGLPLREFTGTRNDRARQARAAGDRAGADQIRGLRKPTAAAWLANQVVREHRGMIESLIALGEDQREAMAAPSGSELRRLNARQREILQALQQVARDLAAASGNPATDQVLTSLTDTFRAALADPRAAESLASGRLAESLTPLAFTDMPDTGASQAARAPRTASPAPPDARDLQEARRERARRDVAAAQGQAEQARRAREQARRSLERARGQTRAAVDLVERLSAELVQATAVRDSSQRAEDGARSAFDRADLAVREADQRLEDARGVLGEGAHAVRRAVEQSYTAGSAGTAGQ